MQGFGAAVAMGYLGGLLVLFTLILYRVCLRSVRNTTSYGTLPKH